MNKTILALSAIVLGVGVALSAVPSALAYRGDPTVKGPNYTAEMHEAMTKAFENNDFNAWKSLMQGKGRVSDVINEGNFARFTEMHKQMLAGNTDEANKIRTELGLGLQNGTGRGMGNGRHMGR